MSYNSNGKSNSNCRPRRARSIHEDISLLVIDNSLSYSHSDKRKIHLNFTDYCFVHRCTNLVQCMKYLKKTTRQEYIIVIFLHLDKEKMQPMISQLSRYEQIRIFFSLYQSSHTDDIECEPSVKIEKSCPFSDGSKLTKSFSEYEPLLTAVQQFIINARNTQEYIGLFKTYNSPEKALRDLGRELGSFVWTHTFRGRYLIRSLFSDR